MENEKWKMVNGKSVRILDLGFNSFSTASNARNTALC